MACHRLITLLGARAGCKIALRHETVSPVHAAIVCLGPKVFAVDLASQNGTRLNGLKLEQERLSDGDVLEIHPWEFRVELQVHNGDDAGEGLLGLEPAPRVVALEHLETKRLLHPGRDICVIGRHPGCDITLADDRVSRAHAMLINYHGYPALADLVSHHGTLVNEEPIHFRVLRADEVVTLGSSKFRVRLVGSSVVEKASENGKVVPGKPAIPRNGAAGPDLINIKAVEGSQRWHIAETAERTAKKS